MGCISCVGLMEEIADAKNKVTLRLKKSTSIPIEADSICPDLFVSRNHVEIEALPVFYGRRKMALGDLFTVTGEKSDSIVVEGKLRHVKRIGQAMTRGQITVLSDIGPHIGSQMCGGEIIINGNAGNWTGAHMRGGRIWIKGNAGHHVGSAYPGEKRGINRGVIIIEGNAGRELGARTRRGLFVVFGDVGEFAGANMIAGSIFVFGRIGKRAGAGNKRGSIIAFGGIAEILPTYRYECRFQPVFLRFYLNQLNHLGLQISSKIADGFFRRYTGDITTVGKGEILVYDQRK